MNLTFGDFTFDSAAHQLWRGGEVVPLEPKMFELLEILIKRRPAVVLNNELDELLWPKVYVARTSLTRLVSELRAVLGDTPRDSKIIRTVYKTGYAFCAVPASPAHPNAIGPAAQLAWNNRLLPLVEGENIAGRGDDCSLVIDAHKVSRRHARITVASGKITIEDLASTNGTQVNGKQISAPTRLLDGSEISLGGVLLHVRIWDPSALTIKSTDETRKQSPAAE